MPHFSFARRRLRLNFWEIIIFGLPLALGLVLLIGWRLRPPAAIDSFAAPRELEALIFAPDGTVLLVQTQTQSPVVGGISTIIPEVTAYDTGTGKRLWREPPGVSASEFAPQGHDVLLQGASFLARRDAKTGVDKWKIATKQSHDFRFVAGGKTIKAWVEVRDAFNGKLVYDHPTLFANRQICYPFWPRLIANRYLRFRTCDLKGSDTMEIFTVDITTKKQNVFRMPFRCTYGELADDSRYGVFLALAKNPRDNSLQLWDIETRRRLRQWPAPNCNQLFAWPRGQSKLEFYASDIDTKYQTPRVFTDGPNLSSQSLKNWEPDETQYFPSDEYALVKENGKVVMRDRVSGKKLRAFPSNVMQATVSADGKWFATAERSDERDYSSPIEIRIWPAD